MTDVTNPPGQPTLHRRVRVHAESLAAMRAELAAPGRPVVLRGLAQQETTDPSLALLDTWAVVCDVVAFYSERIATEGYLRTATERGSVRELARTLGYELRPGVAAQVELAFHVETAPGAPSVVQVPHGTPAQSVPGQGELPQTFETSDDLEARAAWNALPAVAARRQGLGYDVSAVWLTGARTTVRPGDTVLVVGAERREYGRRPGAGSSDGVTGTAGLARDKEKWDVRTVAAVVAEPDGHPGWTRLDLDTPIGFRRSLPLVAREDVRVFALTERTQLFGATAADPALLVSTRTGVPAGIENVGTAADPVYRWIGYAAVDPGAPDRIEIDGDRSGILTDSWIVLDQPGLTEAYRVEDARPDGASKFGLSGRLTRVRVDVAANLDGFDRRQAMVHCTSVELPAVLEPLQEPVSPGATLHVPACDPLLPVGRLVLVHGVDPSGEPVTEVTTVVGCARDATDLPAPVGTGPGTPTMTVTVDPPLTGTYRPGSIVVHANAVAATHGETVRQVLGSGDGRTPFRRFTLRRTPLTSVRARTPSGATPELEVRVDDVRWHQVESLDEAGPQDRVYVVRPSEGTPPGTGDTAEDAGPVTIVQGDGVHGARAATGAENVVATYRVGIGSPGSVTAGQVSLLVRRPLGIRDVVNPGPSHDWAPPETLEEARRNAPQRVRTLDRVVSVADHADLARCYAGIGQARAETVWDGTTSTVVLSVLGVQGAAPSTGLLADLRRTIDDARDPGPALAILPGEVRRFGVRVEIAHDPDHVRADVEAAVRAALEAHLGVAVRDFAAPVTAAEVLVLVHDVPGVVACTMPRLVAAAGGSGSATGTSGGPATDLLVALGARWESPAGATPGLRPAQVLALTPGDVQLGVPDVGPGPATRTATRAARRAVDLGLRMGGAP
ncbi:baseplate J/gp47 family protein [Cellulomonas sp. P24]|uniref:baseplate J/gp47 family protein n=1 Tax=Cellulomonas sp. P24 TaxID=2885206 RepID=UPI00216AB344|nr:baseplate J/gp47 family protein [Cellulomonas sp. P24]MCR6492625.1 baseplate J/gp47 family protein [Cellulomonas sp. P24]